MTEATDNTNACSAENVSGLVSRICFTKLKVSKSFVEDGDRAHDFPKKYFRQNALQLADTQITRRTIHPRS